MSLLAMIFGPVAFVLVLSMSPRSVAAEQSADVPVWLNAHVGEGDGQIALTVLQRARALYMRKVSEGVVRNPCYFAMDATRSADLGGGKLGRRFYVICEADQSFRAISSGHGSGRNLKGVADFSNGRQCAKNFGNAQDSNLTAGGAYITRETKTSFKGYYRVSGKQDAVFKRSFVQFDGEGETANARQRVIGGHPAQVLKGMCVRKKPASPMPARMDTSRTGSWWITQAAAATAAPAGRPRTPAKSCLWCRTTRRRSISIPNCATSMPLPVRWRRGRRHRKPDCTGTRPA